MNNAAVRACDRIMVWGVPLLGFIVPLAVFPSYTFLFIKSAILQCGVAVLFAAWAVKAIEVRSFGVDKKLNIFIVPAFAFLLSAIFNFAFVTSSKDTSIDELMVRVPYFMIFFVTAVAFADIRRGRGLLVWIMGAAFLVSLYGILQHFRLDPFGIGDSSRIQATFGNPNFYTGFLIPVIPVVASAFDLTDAAERKKALSIMTIVLFASVGYYVLLKLASSLTLQAVVMGILFAAVITFCIGLRLREKSAAAVTLFLLVNNLFMTHSRAGQIGLGSAIIVFLVLTFVFVLWGRSWQKTMLISLASLVIAACVALSVVTITQREEGRLSSFKERRYYVKGALELIKRKPILGYGLGTFKNNYPLVKTRESWTYNAMCFEHVSNVYNEHLEVLHDEGAIGFSIYCWLIASVLVFSILAMRTFAKTPLPSPAAGRSRESFWLRTYAPSRLGMLVGLLSGVIALLVSNIFSLSMRYTATGFIYWLFLGLIAAQASTILQSSAKAEAKISISDKPGIPALFKGKRILELAIVLVAVLAIFFAVRVFLADIYMDEAVYHSKAAYTAIENNDRVYHGIFVEGTRYHSDPEEWERAISSYLKTLRYDPFHLRARYFLGNSFNRRWNMNPECNSAWGDKPDERRNDAQRALDQYDYVCRQAPHFTEIDYELGDLYRKLGDLDQAIWYYKEYMRYMPFFTKAHFALAETYAAKRDWAPAAESYKDAIDLNSKFTVAYLSLCAVYHMMRKEDLSAEMLEKARDLLPGKADLLMIDVWEKFGEQDLALESCLECIKRDSTNAPAYSKLGWFYIQKKEWKRAIGAYKKAILVNPGDASGYINLSNLYYQTGNADAAKVNLHKAMEIDPEFVRSVLNRPPNSE